MSEFNYEVIEEIHKSKIWNNHILKVRVKGKDKLYVLKLYGGINASFQKLVFNREMEALKVLNSCNNIVKIRDTATSLKYRGESNFGAILMDYIDGKTLDLYDWNKFTQLKKYEICYAADKKFKSAERVVTQKRTYRIKKLKKGTTYYIKARAVNGKKAGEWSKTCKVLLK